MDHIRFEHCVVSLINAGPVGETIRAQGIPVHSLGMKRSVPSVSAVWKLWKLMRTEKAQILQTWLYHADLLGLLVGKLTRVPVLAWNIRCAFMDMENYPKLSKLVVQLLSRLSGIPDVVVVNSEAGRESHVELGYRPKRFELIPNGFELDRFRPDSFARESIRKELQLSEEAVIIGLVARHDPMKDHHTFLAAAHKVNAAYPHAYFILCGTQVDAENPVLIQLIEMYGLSRCVRLLGPRQDISRITAAFDIACSTALGEGFCNAIGEAMASGVPCVVTDVGDSAQIVSQTGQVVPVRNADAFGKAICDLIQCGHEGRKRLGMQARARIQRFDVSAMALRYEQLYYSLVQRTLSETDQTRRAHDYAKNSTAGFSK